MEDTRRTMINVLKTGLLVLAFVAAFFFLLPGNAKADQLTPEFESTDGSDGANILDDDNFTSEPFTDPGTVITLRSGQGIGYVYIKWDRPPGEWELEAGGETLICGENDFLHELIKLPKSADEVMIHVPHNEETTRIVDIYAYSEGELPDDVQEWLPPCEKADLLFLSTHADDEILFFGGMIPEYTNMQDVELQVAYFTEHYSTGENFRMQEALDGLWTMGVRHYPQFGEFEDLYSESLEEAETQYDHDKGLEYVVRTIRRFKPQVMVGQDLDGEYGHGCHMLTAKLITEAIELTNDAAQYSESANKYGTWQVPKTYLHLFEERPIEMDARKPLENLGNKTALELAKAAYLRHESQQWTWFYVSDGYDDNGEPDGYEYSCTKYGLFDTEVGEDTVTDGVLDNVVLYTNQEAETEEVTSADEEATGVTDEANGSDVEDNPRETTGKGSAGKTILIIVIILVVLVAAYLVIINILKRKRRRELARRRRQQQLRNRRRR